jgi:hypothetical protein
VPPEARIQTLLQSADGSTTLPANAPWELMKGLPVLTRFLAGAAGGDYKDEFTDPLDTACARAAGGVGRAAEHGASEIVHPSLLGG